MAYETKDNTGSLWRNDRKEKETHPDYTGSVRIEGTDMWISGWLKEANGKRFLSLAFKRKDGTAERPEPKPQSFARDLDDEVPF